jgi:hypothetical protein
VCAARDRFFTSSRTAAPVSAAASRGAPASGAAAFVEEHALLASGSAAGAAARRALVDELEATLGDVAADRYTALRENYTRARPHHQYYAVNLYVVRVLLMFASVQNSQFTLQKMHCALSPPRSFPFYAPWSSVLTAVSRRTFVFFTPFICRSHSYRTAHLGLERFRTEAFSWAARVGDDASVAAAEVRPRQRQREKKQ